MVLALVKKREKKLWFYLFFTKARTGNVLWSEINFILIRFVLHVERERAYSGISLACLEIRSRNEEAINS